MSIHVYDIATFCPNGANVRFITRRMRARLTLSDRPVVTAVGVQDLQLQVYTSGTLTIEATPDLNAGDVAILENILSNSGPDTGDNLGRIRRDDLIDLEAPNGTTVFVVDCPALSGPNGCNCYKKRDTWYRVSDDTDVGTL